MTIWRISFKTFLIASVMIGGLLGFALPQAQAQASPVTYTNIQDQGIIFAGICTTLPGENDTCACRTHGQCDLEDVLQVLANISALILAISGSILLVIFLVGGLTWLTSGGSADRIQSGKKIMVGGVIGMLIVFFAYTGVTLIISVLLTGEISETDLEDTVGGFTKYCERTNPATGDLVPCSSDEYCQYFGLDPNDPSRPLSLGNCVPASTEDTVPFETVEP